MSDKELFIAPEIATAARKLFEEVLYSYEQSEGSVIGETSWTDIEGDKRALSREVKGYLKRWESVMTTGVDPGPIANVTPPQKVTGRFWAFTTHGLQDMGIQEVTLATTNNDAD